MCISITSLSAQHLDDVALLESLCFSTPWSRSALEEELTNPCSRFLVAVSGKNVVGYLGCHHIAGEGYITNIAVHPEHRRQGIACALISAAIQQGAALSRLTLEVRKSNAAAIALYESRGFVKDGIRPRFYTAPVEDACIYSYYYPETR